MDDLLVSNRARFETKQNFEKLIGFNLNIIGHIKKINCLIITSDSSQIITGSEDTTIRLWSVITKLQRKVFFGHTGRVLSLAFVSNSLFLSCSSDKTIRIWNLFSGICETILQGHSSVVNCISTAKNSIYAVSGSNDSLVGLWNIKEKRLEKMCSNHNTPVFATVLMKNEKSFFSASEKSLLMWDLPSKTVAHSFQKHQKNISDLIISNNNVFLFTSAQSGQIVVWDIEKKSISYKFQTFYSAAPIKLCINSKDKLLAIFSSTSGAILFDLLTRKPECLKVPGKLNCFAFFPEVSNFAAGFDRELSLWNIGKKEFSFDIHKDILNEIVITSDKRYAISASDDFTVRIWDIQGQKQLHCLTGHTSWVRTMVLSTNGLIFSGSHDNTIRVTRMLTGNCEKVIQEDSWVVSLGITQNNKYLIATLYRGNFKVFKLNYK